MLHWLAVGGRVITSRTPTQRNMKIGSLFEAFGTEMFVTRQRTDTYTIYERRAKFQQTAPVQLNVIVSDSATGAQLANVLAGMLATFRNSEPFH